MDESESRPGGPKRLNGFPFERINGLLDAKLPRKQRVAMVDGARFPAGVMYLRVVHPLSPHLEIIEDAITPGVDREVVAMEVLREAMSICVAAGAPQLMRGTRLVEILNTTDSVVLSNARLVPLGRFPIAALADLIDIMMLDYRIQVTKTRARRRWQPLSRGAGAHAVDVYCTFCRVILLSMANRNADHTRQTNPHTIPCGLWHLAGMASYADHEARFLTYTEARQVARAEVRLARFRTQGGGS